LDHFKIEWEKLWQENVLLGTATSDKDFDFTIVPIDTLGNTAECDVETIKKSLMIQYPSGSRRNDYQITKMPNGKYTVTVKVTSIGTYYLKSKYITANKVQPGKYGFVITVGAPYAPKSSASLYSNSGALTATSMVTAGDQLYIEYDIADRLGSKIEASTLTNAQLTQMNMRYVLTAPFNWWGGTEVFQGDQAYRSGQTYRINLTPIRAGKNTLSPTFAGAPVSCGNCNFFVKHGAYDWQKSVLQPWNEETKKWFNSTLYEIRQRYEWYPRFRFILKDSYDNRVTTPQNLGI
jgi:hypothetical protein